MSDKNTQTKKPTRAAIEAEKRVDYFNKILQELAQATPTTTPLNFSYNFDIRRCIQMQYELEHDYVSLMEAVFDTNPDGVGEDPWDAYETITPVIEEFIATEPDNEDLLELWATIGRFLYFAEGDPPAPGSDLPEKLPCDVTIGAGTFRAGVKTRLVLEKIKWWQDMKEKGHTPPRNNPPHRPAQMATGGMIKNPEKLRLFGDNTSGAFIPLSKSKMLADNARPAGSGKIDIIVPITPEKNHHEWDAAGERCLKCGDKDWLAAGECKPHDTALITCGIDVQRDHVEAVASIDRRKDMEDSIAACFSAGGKIQRRPAEAEQYHYGLHKATVHVLLDALADAARGETIDPEICQSIESIAAEYEHKDFTAEDVLALYECGHQKATDDVANAITNIRESVKGTAFGHILAKDLSLIETALSVAPQGGEDSQHADDAAVNIFAAAMKEKLAQKRAEGREGWQDPERCTAGFLSHLLREHVDKGDPVDVANFCMMLSMRGEGITRPAAEGQKREALDCNCTVKERYSGHRIDCDVPQQKGEAE